MNTSPPSTPPVRDHLHTAVRDRVPPARKVAYGLGNVTTMIGKMATKQFSFQVYNIELGVGAHLIGMVLFLARFWDAITDPLIGYLSDNARTRWGRRRPFLLAGSLLSGISFALLWAAPSGWSETQYFVYFIVIAILFFTALTIYSVPWYALGYELSPDYHERTRVMAYASVFGAVAQMGIPWLYWLSQRSVFETTIEGIRWVGIGAGVVIVIFGLIPAFFTRERIMDNRVLYQQGGETAQKKKKISLLKGVKQAFQNKAFLIVALVVTLVLMGMSIVNSLGTYITIYYVSDGNKDTGAKLIAMLLTAIQIIGLLSIPVITKLATRFGKKQVLMGNLALASAAYLCSWVLFTPEFPYLLLLLALMQGPSVTAVFMLCHSMIGDICDVDELENGERREGLFGAIYAWMFKMGLAIAFLISGYVLLWTGFKPELSTQPESTISAIRMAYALVPFVAYGISILLVWRFPITTESAYRTRDLLEDRRGKL